MLDTLRPITTTFLQSLRFGGVFIDGRNQLGLPFMGDQVHNLVIGCCLNATEHVTKIRVSIKVLCLAVYAPQ